MFLKLRKPEKHAKVRISEHKTKEKPKFLLFLSNESMFFFNYPIKFGSSVTNGYLCRRKRHKALLTDK